MSLKCPWTKTLDITAVHAHPRSVYIRKSLHCCFSTTPPILSCCEELLAFHYILLLFVLNAFSRIEFLPTM